MKFLFFIPLCFILLISTANADKGKCDSGFFYADGECFLIKLSDDQRVALKANLANYESVARECLTVINDIATGIEDKKRTTENEQINAVTNSIIKYLDDTLAFEKSIGSKIKKDKIRKEKNRRYERYGVLGISIYKATFELYEIFDEAKLFDLSRREITAKHNQELDRLNFQLTKAVEVYSQAYMLDEQNITKYRDDVATAIKSSIKKLADIYSSEVANISPANIPQLKMGRLEVFEDIMEDIYEDHDRFNRKMSREYSDD